MKIIKKMIEFIKELFERKPGKYQKYEALETMPRNYYEKEKIMNAILRIVGGRKNLLDADPAYVRQQLNEKYGLNIDRVAVSHYINVLRVHPSPGDCILRGKVEDYSHRERY